MNKNNGINSNSDILNGLTGSGSSSGTTKTKYRTAYHPNGDPVVGTLETVECCAKINGFNAEGAPVYKGETTNYSGTMKAVRKKGERTYVTSDGKTCLESELVFKDGNPGNHLNKTLRYEC